MGRVGRMSKTNLDRLIEEQLIPQIEAAYLADPDNQVIRTRNLRPALTYEIRNFIGDSRDGLVAEGFDRPRRGDDHDD
jgi:hypothetical protein